MDTCLHNTPLDQSKIRLNGDLEMAGVKEGSLFFFLLLYLTSIGAVENVEDK